MKKNILTVFGLTSFFVISIFALTVVSPSSSTSAYANASGSPGSRTGSPGDLSSCNACHAGILNPGSAIATITSASLLSGYTPGQTYTISAGITGTTSNKIGFEATVERDLNNAKTGSLIITDAVRTKTTNFGNAVTHNSTAGTTATAGANAWTFDWTAPVAGTGAVTIYGSFNATNGNGSTSGDQVYTASFNVIEGGVGIDEINSIADIKLYPNPAKSYLHISSNDRVENMKIYNLKGQQVLDVNEPQMLINIEHLPAGMYFVELSNTNQAIVKRLMIQ